MTFEFDVKCNDVGCIASVKLNYAGLVKPREVYSKGIDNGTALADAVYEMFTELEGYESLQKLLIKEAIIWMS